MDGTYLADRVADGYALNSLGGNIRQVFEEIFLEMFTESSMFDVMEMNSFRIRWLQSGCEDSEDGKMEKDKSPARCGQDYSSEN